jgi:hypothetical protein
MLERRTERAPGIANLPIGFEIGQSKIGIYPKANPEIGGPGGLPRELSHYAFDS